MPCAYRLSLVIAIENAIPSIPVPVLAKESARDFPVVKLNGPLAQNLVVLVPLARQEHHVARTRLVQRSRNRFLAVWLDDDLCLGALDSHNRVIDDQQRVLAPRIVRRQDDNVAGLARGFAHEWALRAGAGPAATKQSDHTP